MQLDKFVVVTGMPGIYKMAANRSNGLIVQDLDSGKKKFVSARLHQHGVESRRCLLRDKQDVSRNER